MPTAKVTRLPARRSRLVERFMELRPALVAIMQAAVPEELRTELGAITGHQLQALARLPRGGLTMHELAQALEISGASACALADRLVSRGLVVRETDTADRRVVRLVRTELGDHLAGRYAESKHRQVAALFGRLSDEQAEEFVKVIELLAADLAGEATSPLTAAPAIAPIKPIKAPKASEVSS